MRTAIFPLVDPSYECIDPNFGEIFSLTYVVPFLPAFSIIHHSVGIERTTDWDGQRLQYSTHIDHDKVLISGYRSFFQEQDVGASLTICHVGVRDYQYFFTYAKRPLAKRLGELAEEADKSFETGSWFSFIICAGSVIEGILSSIFGGGTLKKLIAKAVDSELISEFEGNELDMMRVSRNLVHPMKYEHSFINRRDAMSVYSIYLRLLTTDWSRRLDKMENGKSEERYNE